MYTNEQLNAIYSSKIGLEFEFFSNSNLSETKNSVSRVLNKKIYIEEKAHSAFSPTGDVFKMEPDNSGGTGMIELVTGSLPFVESKLIIAKMLKWIRENGSTNDKCSIHVNISFDVSKIGPNINISKLDIGKFVLSFDEDKVYEAFPNRKNSVYAKSIKHIFPLNGMSRMSTAAAIWHNYQFVNEKYYGINFTKLPKNYIEFRYIGGKDYHLRYDDIMKLSEHFIVSLYECLKNPTYSESDLNQLNEILKKYNTIREAYKSFSNFKKIFTKINLLIDLKTATSIIETYYPKIRNAIFEIIMKGDMKEGLINYDTDTSKLQIKDAKLIRCFEIVGIDIVDSEIKGNIINCDIFNSKISDASVMSSNVFGASKITDSKVCDSYVSKNVTCKNSYIFGRNGIFSGTLDGGIFREGRATKFAQFKNGTEVIEVEKIK